MVPDAAATLEKYPLPNAPGGALGPRTFNSSFSTAIDREQYSGRIDHRFSDKDSLFIRLSYSDNSVPYTSAALAVLDPGFSNSRRSDWRNGGVSHTHVFNERL